MKIWAKFGVFREIWAKFGGKKSPRNLGRNLGQFTRKCETKFGWYPRERQHEANPELVHGGQFHRVRELSTCVTVHLSTLRYHASLLLLSSRAGALYICAPTTRGTCHL